MKIYTKNSYKKLLAISLLTFLSYEIEAAKKETTAQKSSQEQLQSAEMSRTVLALVINNLSIVAQIGLVNTSAANPALTTPLTIPSGSTEVGAYNSAISTALGLVATAVTTPLAANTTAAIDSLATAIGDFNTVIADDATKPVTSLYSIVEINDALAELQAQLNYLLILQTA